LHESFEEKGTPCRSQFVDFISHFLGTSIPNHNSYLALPGSWEAVSGASDWLVLGGLAILLMSIPTSESENERLIAMKKNVVGESGGPSKNEQVTARTQIRLCNLQKQGNAE
jgi:hypothetical protein